jgi:hypothetical protein
MAAKRDAAFSTACGGETQPSRTARFRSFEVFQTLVAYFVSLRPSPSPPLTFLLTEDTLYCEF